MKKVPVADVRIKPLTTAAEYVAEQMAVIIHIHTGEEISECMNWLYPLTWRRYLRTQATHAQLS